MILQTICIKRAQGHFDLLDISVKGQHKIGKHFAPCWDIVTGHQKGKITDAQYREVYHDMMLASYYAHPEQWMWVLGQQRVVLACYCQPFKFCHRRILAEYLIKLACYLGLPPIDFRGEIT